ncbi:MAG: SOUL family heme-binding protein [Alphaproteobacteria bacterium]
MRTVIWVLGGLGVLAAGTVAAWWYNTRHIETPNYVVVSRDGDMELRDYPAMTVAEVVRDGARGQALRGGFRPLAGYIFAKERGGEKIAMTAPVTQEPAGGGSWRVRFIMPRDRSLDDLPRPAQADVRLLRTEPQRMAAVRFSGGWDDAAIATQEERLRAWIAERGLDATTVATYAYYDDPFTPGFLRRNEVLIGVGGG